MSAFNSVNVVKGEEYTASFYVKQDDGIFNQDLVNCTGTYELYTLATDGLVLTKILAFDLDEEGFHKAKVTLTATDTNGLIRTVEEAEDQYLKRSGYWAKIKVVGLPINPTLAVVSKINVV